MLLEGSKDVCTIMRNERSKPSTHETGQQLTVQFIEKLEARHVTPSNLFTSLPTKQHLAATTQQAGTQLPGEREFLPSDKLAMPGEVIGSESSPCRCALTI